MTFTYKPYVEACFRRSLKYRLVALLTATAGSLLFAALWFASERFGVQVLSKRSCAMASVCLGLAAVALLVDILLSIFAHGREEQ